MDKEKREKAYRKIRKMEGEIAYATPKKAAKLAGAIARLKATLFD